MLCSFGDGKVTLELEPSQVKRFEDYLQLEIRKTRLFQSDRERFLEFKHDQLQRRLTKIRDLSKAAMTVDNEETIDPAAYKLAGALYELTDILLDKWELPEGDENAHQQSNPD